MDSTIKKAAIDILRGQALLVTAGAGMGVDSGLPDFRGSEGFWKAYPAYARMGIRFEEMANPRWFQHDPSFAWGFYGHRLSLYRNTVPHAGFALLRKWSQRMSHGMFVYTSNVDGQFQCSGFEEARVVEAHGSIHHMQCVKECGVGIFTADGIEIDVDKETMRSRGPLPACPRCGSLARPNILMFNDWNWDERRTEMQQRHFEQWRRNISGQLVVIECGAGEALPHIRRVSEEMLRQYKASLIRINPRDCEVPDQQVSIALGSLTALQSIDTVLESVSL